MHEQENFNLYIASLALLITFMLFIIIYVIVHRQRQNQLHLEKEKLATEYQNQLLTATIKEQERVLNRLSNELHDNLGQSLSFIKMSLSVITRRAEPVNDTRLTDDTHKMLDTVISEVHNISHVLNSNYIKKQGLAQLFQLELDHMRTHLSLLGVLQQSGTTKIKDPEQELLVYRIAQEAFHNIIKHAKADSISVNLIFGKDFQMEIKDDGIGFDTSVSRSGSGIGLQNMTDRTQLLGGILSIDTAPGKGTTVRLVIPDVNGHH